MLKIEKHFTLVSIALSKQRYRFLVFSETSEYHCGQGTLLEIIRFLGSLVAQLVKNLPAMCKSWVRSLGWEDPLETGTATHSSNLAPEFQGLYSKESDTTETFTYAWSPLSGLVL